MEKLKIAGSNKDILLFVKRYWWLFAVVFTIVIALSSSRFICLLFYTCYQDFPEFGEAIIKHFGWLKSQCFKYCIIPGPPIY